MENVEVLDRPIRLLGTLVRHHLIIDVLIRLLHLIRLTIPFDSFFQL